ncbi:MAG TPA: hypothetical protein V6C78_00100 [Crinalium sp.]
MESFDESDYESENEADLKTTLQTLVNEHGLIEVLENLKEFVEAKAETVERLSDQDVDKQSEAFRDVARALTVLIKALPPELDVQIALDQITHASSNLE